MGQDVPGHCFFRREGLESLRRILPGRSSRLVWNLRRFLASNIQAWLNTGAEAPRSNHLERRPLALSLSLPCAVFATNLHAADRPVPQAAPIEFVRICDASGAGFFYIPGTNKCLRPGGPVLGDARALSLYYSLAGSLFYAGGIVHFMDRARSVTGAGLVPLPKLHQNARSRDALVFFAPIEVELDQRTQLIWGPVLASARADDSYGAGASAQLGGLGEQANTFAESRVPRRAATFDNPFIRFAGLTSGRTDFLSNSYADAHNYESMRGQGATVGLLLAYTATFGDRFSSTFSFEDRLLRPEPSGSWNITTRAAPIGVDGAVGASFQGKSAGAGARISEIVGNLRLDQPWGGVRASDTAHPQQSSLFPNSYLATIAPFPAPAGFSPPDAAPALTSSSYGFGTQDGEQTNLDYLSPGDKLWLQAAYEKGAVGYVSGNNVVNAYSSVSQNPNLASGLGPDPNFAGWNPHINSNCVFAGNGNCEQQWGWDIKGAYKNYWLPILSSTIFGSYLEVRNKVDATNGFGSSVGGSNRNESRIEANLFRSPLRGFDIGAEYMYEHLSRVRPSGLAVDPGVSSSGLPTFSPSTDVYGGRLRVQRDF
jgi:hypothetical protein